MKITFGKKEFFMKMLFLLTTILMTNVQAQELLLGWNASNNGGGFGISPWPAETQNASIETSGLIRGSNIGTSGSPAGGAWGGAGGWIGVPGGSFYFMMKAPNHKISLSSISTVTRRSNTGPQNYILYYSINGGDVVTVGSGSTSSTNATGTPNSHSLTEITELQDILAGTEITFYIKPSGSTGNYYLTGGTNSLRVNGTMAGPPPAPDASPQELCGVATVADLIAQGTDLKWYATADSTDVLAPDTVLSSGIYYVTQTIDGFESPRTAVTVTINEIPAAPVAEAQSFCGTATVTVADLIPSLESVVENFGTTNRVLSVGDHTFDSGTWNVVSPQVLVNTSGAYSGASLILTNTGTIVSPEFEGLKSVSFYAITSGSNQSEHLLRISKIVNGVETLVKEINMNGIDTYTPFTVNINESVGTRIKFECVGEGIRRIDDVSFIQGPIIKWYDTPAGTTPLAQDASLQTGTYYVSQTLNGCESPRTSVQVSISEVPNAPVVEDQTFCGPAIVADLIPQSINSSDIIFQDSFDNLDNWNVVNILGSKTWGITAFGNPSNSALINGFQENNEDWLVLKPVAIPSTVSNATFSFDSASNYIGPDLEVFYTTNYTDDVNTTIWSTLSPTLSTTGYFVFLNSGAVDVSSAIGTDLAIAFKYKSSTGTNNAKAWEIDNVKIETTESTIINWYSSLDATETLTPETALETGTYYVSQTVNGCESERIEVQITVNDIPEAPVAEAQAFCGEATVGDLEPSFLGVEQSPVVEEFTTDFPQGILPSTFDFSSGTWAFQEVNIVHQSIGGDQDLIYMLDASSEVVTPEFNGITSISISARNAGHSAGVQNLKVFKIVNNEETLVGEIGVQSSGTISLFDYEVPIDENENVRLKFSYGSSNSEPNLFPVFINRVTFNLPEGNGISWYNVPEEGEALASETPLETGTYYVSLTENGCESERTSVEVTINEIPSAPVVEAQVFCGEPTVDDLTAEGTDVKWYATEDSEEVLAPETELETGTYYVSQTSAEGCESERTAVEITVNELPAAPVVQAQAFCSEATVADLEAEGTDIKWYATEDSEEVLTPETELETGTYYVSQTTVDGCESERTAVEVAINELPAAPVAQAQAFCGEATVADLIAEGTDIKWYATEDSEEALTPETALQTAIYYASQTTVDGCESDRTSVEVTINEIPAPPVVVNPLQYYEGDTLADLEVEGENLTWYDADGNILDPFTTLIVEGEVYFVSQTINGCESEKTEIETEFLGVQSSDFAEFTYYPNPVKSVLHLSNDTKIRQVLIYTLAGELVMSKEVNSKKAELNIAHLPTDTFVVKVLTDKEVKTVKIIKR